MAKLKLLVDTNVIVDYLNVRDHYESARLLMICGRFGEFELWATASQMTDLIYILSDGGKKSLIPEVLGRLRGLRSFVNVCTVGPAQVDKMLSTSWKDPENALLFELALEMKADAVVTTNTKDFESSLVKVLTSDELFDWVESTYNIRYDEVVL